jgi:acetolactate synthase-1/2/3 large subunit
VKSVLREILKLVKAEAWLADAPVQAKWWEQIETWRTKQCLAYNRSSGKIKPQFAIETLYKISNGDLFLTSDVGQHQMFTAQFYKFTQPRRWINSGGLGTMGFGLPAAMGVQLAHPGKSVACVSGEASILMCIQELATCKQHDLPLKIVLMNNGYMGMVRQWQEMFYDKRYSHSYVEALPDFVKLAESFGHVGMRFNRPEDLEAGMREAFAMKDRLVLMDIAVDPSENVYPMIAMGKGHHEMHLSPEQELA